MADKIIPKVWITKYALTQGVFTLKNARGYDVKTISDDGKFIAYYRVPHWHTTESAAIAQVAKMIAAKRKSIAKTLAALDATAKKYGIKE